MIIEKIEIESFAGIKGKSIDFCNGVNLIEGSNESGKSSIADFIKFVLYGAAGKASDGHLAERKKAINYYDSHAAGSMTVKVGEKRYKINRSLSVSGGAKELLRNRFSIIDLDSGAELEDKKTEPGEQLLGIPENIFVSSAYLSQNEKNDIKSGDINEAISNILFSGDERVSVEKAIDKIEKARIPLSHKNTGAGRIQDIKDEIASLRECLEQQMQTNEQIIALESSVSEKQKINREHIAKCEQLQNQKKAYDNARLLQDIEALRDAEEQKMNAELALLEFKAQAHIPTDDEMDELSMYERSITKLESQKESLGAQRARIELEKSQLGSFDALLSTAQQLGSVESIARSVSSSTAFAKSMLIGAFISLLLCVGSVAASFALSELQLYLIIAAAALGVITAALFALSTLKRSAAHSLAKKAGAQDATSLDALISSYNAASNKMKELDEKLADTDMQSTECIQLLKNEKNRLREYLCDMDIEDLSDPASSMQKVSEALRARMRKAAQLEMEDSSKRAYYEALRTKTENADAEKLKAELESCGIESPLDCDGEKLERNIEFYRKQSELLTATIHDSELTLTKLRQGVSSPSKINEQIAELSEELSDCEQRYNVYMLAASSLRAASEELRRGISPHLAKEAGRYMSALTNERYTTLELDASFTLSFESYGESRHLDYLSRGTRDMAYMSLRLALADFISNIGPLPMILDEATAHLDDTRAQYLIKLLLDRSSEGHQHILFTCHGREIALLEGFAQEYKYIKLS